MFDDIEDDLGAIGPQPPVGRELVVPGIGEIVPLDDPQKVAFALGGIRDLENNLREIKSALTDALVEASKLQGTKTLHLDGLDAIIKSGTKVEYDPIAIEAGLREAGMPEERIREIVKETVSYSVDAVKAKQAAGANPAYAAVIEANKQTIEAAPSVTLKR